MLIHIARLLCGQGLDKTQRRLLAVLLTRLPETLFCGQLLQPTMTEIGNAVSWVS